MDRILPIDLERAQLRKSFRGYARKDVEALIKGAAESLQQALVENDRLRHELELARAELGRTRSQEDTLKETLVMAQKAADDTRAAAQRHAENVLEEARQSALAEKVAAQQQVSEMRWEMERLKVERQKFADEFRNILDRYLRDVSFVNPLTVVENEEAASA